MLGVEILGNSVLGAFTVEGSPVIPSVVPFPLFEVDGWLSDDLPKSPDAQFPLFSINGEFGFEAKVKFVAFSLVGEFTQIYLFDGDVSFPSFNIAGSFSQEALFNADIAFPSFGLSSEFGFEGGANYPVFSLSGGFDNVETFRGELPFPLLTVAGEFRNVEYFYAEIPFVSFTNGEFLGEIGFLSWSVSGTFSETLPNLHAAHVLNTNTSELTRYSNYQFNHMVRIGNVEYGVNSSGFFELGGLTYYDPVLPVPVNGQILTKDTDFGVFQSKRLQWVYLNSDTETKVTPFHDGMQKMAQTSSFGGRKVKMAKGNSSRYAQLKIEGIVQLEGMEVLTDMNENQRQRRVK